MTWTCPGTGPGCLVHDDHEQAQALVEELADLAGRLEQNRILREVGGANLTSGLQGRTWEEFFQISVKVLLFGQPGDFERLQEMQRRLVPSVKCWSGQLPQELKRGR